MSPRNLFIIILKVLGIFFAFNIFYSLAALPGTLLNFFDPDEIWFALYGLLLLVLFCAITYYLIFKTDVVVDKLKLTRGFDEEIIPLNVHRSTVLTITIIIFAAILLTNQIPILLNMLYYSFQRTILTHGILSSQNKYSILIPLAKVIIGLLLISYPKKVVNFIEVRRKK